MALKIFAILFVSSICLNLIQCDLLEMITEAHNNCVAETGVDEALIDEANNYNLLPDPNLKCYIKCIMTNIGILSPEGVVLTDVMVSMVPENLIPIYKPIIDHCGTQTGVDHCDTAYQTHKCYFDYDRESYYLA